MVPPTDRLGKYELVRHLASGGMARVYLARVSGVGGFERHVVLKTMRPERTEDESYIAMFLDEARVVATLHHQHVAQVYEVGVADDGTYFLAMEYLHGETVRSVLERARQRSLRLPLEFGLTTVCAAAAGLHHAHDRRGIDGQSLGIVHRDVSPSNVIVCYDGSVKVIDFGIAKSEDRSTRTQTGFVKGKAGYMAPEQALGYAVDRRSDVFALGVVLYELTTQARAFRAASEYEAVQRIVRGDIKPPSTILEHYPPELEDVVLTALQVDPDDRFQDADAMRRAIELTAYHLGVRSGTPAVTRVLHDLFGARAEPWLILPGAEDAANQAASPARFPRGSAGHQDPMVRGMASGEADDQPTCQFITMDDGPSEPAARIYSPAPAIQPPVPPRPTTVRLPAPPRAPQTMAPPVASLIEGLPLTPPGSTMPAREATPPPRPRPITFNTTAPVQALPRLAGLGTGPSAVIPERRWLGPVVALMCAVIAIVTVVILLGTGVGSEPATVRGAATDEPVAPVPPPVEPTPPTVVEAPVVVQPPARPAPPAGHVAVRITSLPVGATVVLDGVRLGVTPVETTVAIEQGKPVTLKIRKSHYYTEKLKVPLDRDVEWDGALRPRR